MNLRQLEYWVAVVDTGSFTRAAAQMHVSQPGLSQQIRVLEKEFGGQLLERLPRGIRLTAAGKAFLPEARATVLAAQRAARAAHEALSLRTGQLEIATVRSVAVGILPPAIRELYERHPGVEIRLHEYAHRLDLERGLRSGVADIAVGPAPLELDGPVELLGWEEFVAIIGPRDAVWHVPEGQRVPLETLADRDWILFPPDHGLWVLVAEACGRAGFVPRKTVETQQVEAAVRLAAAGVGVALVPESIVPVDLRAHARRLRRPVARRLTAYTRSEWSPAAGGFLEVLKAQAWGSRPRNAEVIG
jgi:DNA-binding transcriptional LysR family regulator